MTPHVELVYDRTCPNAVPARERIRKALAQAGLPADWREWDRDAAESPAYVQQYASPTVLVNGRDVAATGEAATIDGGAGCRVYVGVSGEISGVPPLEVNLAALTNTQEERR